MKPERIQPPRTPEAERKTLSESEATAAPPPALEPATRVDSTFALDPSLEAPFLIGVLHRARTLQRPPRIQIGIGEDVELTLDWGEDAPPAGAEHPLTVWIHAFYEHLSAAAAE